MNDTMPGPFFLADHTALDFLNSVASPQGTPLESISSGKALLLWLTRAGLIDLEAGADLKQRFPDAVLDHLAAEARDLREWFRNIVERRKEGGPDAIRPRDLGKLNTWLEEGCSYAQLKDAASGISVMQKRRWAKPASVLVPLAEVMAQLLVAGNFNLIRKCENPACTLWFYDRTKGHRRRWCAMAICGNRAKVAAYRERAKWDAE
jgi:predicted RNA-binding Zn ribbon-like protein